MDKIDRNGDGEDVLINQSAVRLPLAGLRVLAIEQYGAGPFGTLQLSELGAEVIKIEDPRTGGDIGRYVPPFQSGEDSLFFETFNRGKRSLSLDLTNSSGRKVFHDLVRVSDVVYSNLRGDVPARLGIRYDELKHLNPAIVCCSLTGFGMTGPRSAEPGYDYILQGMTGWMSITGEPDGPPTKTGLSLVDLTGGIVAALAVLAGVHAARRDGVGLDCDLSLFDVAMGMLNYPATWYLNEEVEPERIASSAHPSVVPFQNFQTADGWIVVACPKEKFWQRLTVVLNRQELADDPRFVDFAARSQHRKELLAILEPLFSSAKSATWLSQLVAAGVPAGPINSFAEAFAEPQVTARNILVSTEHPIWGTVRHVASPVRVGTRTATPRRAPRRGEDSDDILENLLKYTPERRFDLERDGAFGLIANDESSAATL